MDAFFIFGAKYLYILSVIVLVALFLKTPSAEKRKMIIFFALSFALSYTMALVARELYFNPRPFVVGEFTPLIPHTGDNGFPSDHTLLVSAIAAGMMYFNRRASALLWIIALAVGLSRVYVGVHHPIDIIGSIAIALTGAYFVHLFLKRRVNVTIAEIN